MLKPQNVPYGPHNDYIFKYTAVSRKVVQLKSIKAYATIPKDILGIQQLLGIIACPLRLLLILLSKIFNFGFDVIPLIMFVIFGPLVGFFVK